MSQTLPLRKFFGREIPERLCHRIAAASFFFLMGIGFSCFASRIPDIKSFLSLSDKDFGTVLLFIPAGQFTAMVFSSFLVSKFGSRNILTLGVFLYSTMLVIISCATEVWQLRLCLWFWGMGGNFCNISINTQGVGVEKIYKRSIMGSFHGMWSIAGFIGGVSSIFIVKFGLSTFQHFMMMWVLALIFVLSLRRYLISKDFNPETEKRRLLRAPRFDKYIVMLGLIAFCCMACEGTMFDWSIIYFEDIVNAPENLKRFGFASFMCMMAFGRFTSDKAVMRIGTIRVLKISGIVIAGGLGLAVIFPHILTATIGFAFVGLGVSSIVPLCYSLAGRSRTLAPGAALTGVASIGFFGFLLGPPVIGYISEYSSLRWSFTLIAIIGLMVTALAPRLKTPEIADE